MQTQGWKVNRMCDQLKMQHNECRSIPVHGTCPCRQSVTEKISSQNSHFCKRPWVNIYWFFCQYLTPGVIWGLYVRLGDTPGAKRSFLVDITPSRVVFSAIFVPRGVCDNSEMCIRARSLVMRLLTQTGFLTSDLTCDPWKWTNTMSETGIEPSCVGIGQKLVSVDQKASATMVMEYPTLWLRILRIFFLVDTWLYSRNFSHN